VAVRNAFACADRDTHGHAGTNCYTDDDTNTDSGTDGDTHTYA
jgi:hypothetical protein